MSQNESSHGVCFRKEEREPSWEADLLGRKDAAHQLERLIANAPGPYVIAMTSEWGSGKTFCSTHRKGLLTAFLTAKTI